jgi:hypothetical protein
MLAEILRRCPGTLSLPGEMNPYVAVAQVCGGGASLVRSELACDVGRPAADHEVDLHRLAADVAWRLLAQWPALDLGGSVRAAVADAAGEAHPARDPDGFTVEVLRRVAQVRPEVTPTVYDVRDRGDASWPPPTAPVIEMTPYVGFRAWRGPTEAELSTAPLVVSTPRNSYRLSWLVRLFGRARVRVVHLTRNPAAAVNGLIDGWRHPGFLSTPVDVDLRIAGYSDELPWGRRWWSYDGPPEWRRFTDRALATVAAEQWRSAHAAVVAFSDRSDVPTLRIAYESLVGTAEERTTAATRLAEFIGVEPRALRAAVESGVPPVMATATPSPRRWGRTANDLAPALAEPAVWETAAALGYEAEERLWI